MPNFCNLVIPLKWEHCHPAYWRLIRRRSNLMCEKSGLNKGSSIQQRRTKSNKASKSLWRIAVSLSFTSDETSKSSSNSRDGLNGGNSVHPSGLKILDGPAFTFSITSVTGKYFTRQWKRMFNYNLISPKFKI